MKNVDRTKALTIAALMAALVNILSTEPRTIPIVIGPFASKIHFT